MTNKFNNTEKRICFTLIVITLLLGCSINSFSQTNLLVNGDFEDGLTNWTSWGGSLDVSEDAHGGSHAAFMSERTEGYHGPVTDITSIIQNGVEYNLSAWVKFTDATKNFRATIRITVDGETSYNSVFWTGEPVIGEYVEYSQAISYTWVGELEKIELIFETSDIDGQYTDYLIDDIVLKEVPGDSDLLIGDGLKDIKSTMLIGALAQAGPTNFYSSDAVKRLTRNEFNVATVNNYPAWYGWDENEKHVYHLEQFNTKLNLIAPEDIKITTHMLIGWDHYFPKWFYENDFEPDTLDAIMESWIKAVITYKNNDSILSTYNVINEPISFDGKGNYWPLNSNGNDQACEFQRMGFEPDASGLSEDLIQHAEHPVYIRKAFEYARKYTDKKLELRENNCEFPKDYKYKAFYQLAAHLKNVGAPVDVIGFQGHFKIEDYVNDWEGFVNNIRRFKDLGYEVHLTEVDMGDDKNNFDEKTSEMQKTAYYQMVTSAIRGGVSEFHMWNSLDNNGAYLEEQHPYLFTINYEPKPAYFGFKEALIDMSHILFWEMEESSEQIMEDVMKYGNHGVMHNFLDPQFVDGVRNNALEFDGIDDYITVANLSDTIQDDLTVAVYFKSDKTKNANLFGLNNKDTELVVGIDESGVPYASINNSPISFDLTNFASLHDEEWHFLALRRDSATYSLAIDNEIVFANTEYNPDHFYQFTLGSDKDNSLPFSGVLDEVKIYDQFMDKEVFVRNMLPMAPIIKSVNAANYNAKVVWVDESINEDGFVIERKIGDGDWSEVTVVEENFTEWSDTVEYYESDYSYRICSFNRFGRSKYSKIITDKSSKKPIDTGVQTNKSNVLLEIFPNPTSDYVNVLHAEGAYVHIYNIQGILVLKFALQSSHAKIYLGELPNGMYSVRVIDHEMVTTRKLLKQ